MKKLSLVVLALMPIVSLPVTAEVTTETTQGEYIDWRLLAVSHRQDKPSLRAILGNDIAIKTVRTQKTQPWADGSIIAKVVWKESTHPKWSAAIIAGEMMAAEAMIKDSKRFADTGGWGFGFWKQGKLEMHPEEKSKTCFACHTAVKDSDYVFTIPALK